MNRDICKNKNLCTGCTACAHVCPKKCIEMRPDNEGFLYPEINESLCMNCKLCEKVCPVNNPPEKRNVKKGFVARNKDIQVVLHSTSGGTSAAFAEYTFSKDGVLFGVGYDDNMRVRHFSVDKSEKDRVSEMRGSKYVQSMLGNSFLHIKELLDNNKFVCFIGTPCQVAGLKAFLNKENDNLLTVDLVCHGASSPVVFEKYIEYQTEKYKSKPIDVRFRNKTYGYHSGTMMIEYENGQKYYGSGRVDYMLKAYFAGACSRYSCYQCPYKGIDRCSDLTIFDSWHIDKLVAGQKDDDKGYTNIFIHTDKGMEALESMSKFFDIWEADSNMMHQLDGAMISNNPKKAECRENLIEDIQKDGFYETMQKNLPVSQKDHIIEMTKTAAYKTGMFKLLKK